MAFDVQHVLMFGLQAIIFIIYAVLTILLIRFRQQTHDNSRYILLTIALMGCIGAGITGVNMLHSKEFMLTESLYRWRIMGCIMACELMILYPYEFKHPLELSVWEILLLMIPGHVFFLLFFCCGIEYRQLATPSDVWMYLNEFNVYIRVLPIVLMTISWFVMMPKMVRWFNEPESFWPKAYVIAGCVNGLCFTFALISGDMISLLAYKLWFGFLFPVFIGYDLYNRYNLHTKTKAAVVNESIKDFKPLVDEHSISNLTLKNDDETGDREDFSNKSVNNDSLYSENLLEVVWGRFEELMDKNELWADPQLTLDQLVRKIGTNHTYLLEAIKQHTGYTYTEYINRRRIHYVDETMRLDPNKNIQQAFVDAGYCSRSTAWRNYKLYSEKEQR